MSQITDVPGIADALGERSVIALDELQARLDSGEARLWRSETSAIFLQRIEYENGEVVLHAGPAGGVFDEIKAVTPDLETWARSIGCTQVHIHAGREGWARAFKPQGYELYQIVLRKVLS